MGDDSFVVAQLGKAVVVSDFDWRLVEADSSALTRSMSWQSRHFHKV